MGQYNINSGIFKILDKIYIFVHSGKCFCSSDAWEMMISYSWSEKTGGIQHLVDLSSTDM